MRPQDRPDSTAARSADLTKYSDLTMKPPMVKSRQENLKRRSTRGPP